MPKSRLSDQDKLSRHHPYEAKYAKKRPVDDFRMQDNANMERNEDNSFNILGESRSQTARLKKYTIPRRSSASSSSAHGTADVGSKDQVRFVVEPDSTMEESPSMNKDSSSVTKDSPSMTMKFKTSMTKKFRSYSISRKKIKNMRKSKNKKVRRPR